MRSIRKSNSFKFFLARKRHNLQKLRICDHIRQNMNLFASSIFFVEFLSICVFSLVFWKEAYKAFAALFFCLTLLKFLKLLRFELINLLLKEKASFAVQIYFSIFVFWNRGVIEIKIWNHRPVFRDISKNMKHYHYINFKKIKINLASWNKSQIPNKAVENPPKFLKRKCISLYAVIKINKHNLLNWIYYRIYLLTSFLMLSKIWTVFFNHF